MLDHVAKTHVLRAPRTCLVCAFRCHVESTMKLHEKQKTHVKLASGFTESCIQVDLGVDLLPHLEKLSVEESQGLWKA